MARDKTYQFSAGQIEDTYEKVLLDHQDELYLSLTEGERNAFLDGAYVLYVALTEGARR